MIGTAKVVGGAMPLGDDIFSLDMKEEEEEVLSYKDEQVRSLQGSYNCGYIGPYAFYICCDFHVRVQREDVDDTVRETSLDESACVSETSSPGSSYGSPKDVGIE